MIDVKWIKLSTQIFDHKKIYAIESLPEGDTILVIWLKLLTMAGQNNDNGAIFFTKDIPYTMKMLSNVMRRKESIVSLALNTFKSFEMIDIEDSMIYIKNWEKYQSADKLSQIKEQNKLRQRKYRDKQKELIESNVTETLQITQRHATDIDIELDKDKDKKVSKKQPHFTKPTTLQLTEYFKQINLTTNPSYFYDYYESKGWLVGKAPMKCWKAAARQWKARDKKETVINPSRPKKPPCDEYGRPYKIVDGKTVYLEVE